ncbi:MAG: hypothetical protein K6G16_00420 [Lachnospiraceae bacterium]|nr:hypothetical protein [Lachnospiraceae bacterium]
MRIAVYDDNIADRRYAERLFKRESDRVHSRGEESFVIDCFGSTEKLYPMADTYDVFLIDQTGDPQVNGLDIARSLRARGILQPIILGVSAIDYRADVRETDGNLFFLDKPYEEDALCEVFRISEKHLVRREKKIELRTEGETVCTDSNAILYAVEADHGYVTVVLRDHAPVRVQNSVSSLYKMIQDIKKDPSLIPVSLKAFVHASGVSRTGLMHVIMQDGKKLGVSPVFLVNLRELRKRGRGDQ